MLLGGRPIDLSMDRNPSWLLGPVAGVSKQPEAGVSDRNKYHVVRLQFECNTGAGHECDLCQ